MGGVRGGGADGGVGALLLGAEGGVVGGAGEGLLEGIGLEIKVASLWLRGRALLGAVRAVATSGGRGGVCDDVVVGVLVLELELVRGAMGERRRGHDVGLLRGSCSGEDDDESRIRE